MAGRGKRMRPQSLTTPKPMIPVAGKPIVQWLVEKLCAMTDDVIDNIVYIINEDFGQEIESKLHQIGKELGAKSSIVYQREALGTAHAIYCAKDFLEGPTIVGFADTIFDADFTISSEVDGIIWVKQVDDPSAFGVVKMDEKGIINDFVEKPSEFVSDLAIIGVYYFKNGLALRNELKFLIDNNIREKGEFQITNALESLKNKGYNFLPGKVMEWLDCGNKNATVASNKRVLELGLVSKQKRENLTIENTEIIEPVYIGSNVFLKDSKVGPYVSIGEGSSLSKTEIENSIVQNFSKIIDTKLHNSMVGNYVHYNGSKDELNIGDYSTKGK